MCGKLQWSIFLLKCKKPKELNKNIQLVNIILLFQKNAVQYMKIQQETEILAFP